MRERANSYSPFLAETKNSIKANKPTQMTRRQSGITTYSSKTLPLTKEPKPSKATSGQSNEKAGNVPIPTKKVTFSFISSYHDNVCNIEKPFNSPKLSNTTGTQTSKQLGANKNESILNNYVVTNENELLDTLGTSTNIGKDKATEEKEPLASCDNEELKKSQNKDQNITFTFTGAQQNKNPADNISTEDTLPTSINNITAVVDSLLSHPYLSTLPSQDPPDKEAVNKKNHAGFVDNSNCSPLFFSSSNFSNLSIDEYTSIIDKDGAHGLATNVYIPTYYNSTNLTENTDPTNTAELKTAIYKPKLAVRRSRSFTSDTFNSSQRYHF